jgi:hypothetical protein
MGRISTGAVSSKTGLSDALLDLDLEAFLATVKNQERFGKGGENNGNGGERNSGVLLSVNGLSGNERWQGLGIGLISEKGWSKKTRCYWNQAMKIINLC